MSCRAGMRRSEGGIRILLVYASEVRSRIIDASLRVAPIGLFFVNGALVAKGHRTKILNLVPERLKASHPGAAAYREALKREVTELDPHYVGYSFRNLFHWGDRPEDPTQLVNFASLSLEKPVVEFLREVTAVPIIGGGAAYTLAPRLHMEHLGLDYGIRGEGEVFFETLVTKLHAGIDPGNIPGLVYRRGDTIVLNPVERIPDLAAIPPMSTGDLPDYRQLYYDNAGYGNIQTKRGCAFRCVYCQYPFLEGTEYRLRKMETIIEEIAVIRAQHGVRHFFIVDSVFSTPVQWSIRFCDALIESGLDIEWGAYINPRGITQEVIRKYKSAGCHNLVLTPDALSAPVLARYRKEFTIAEVRTSIEAIRTIGVPFEVSVILGGPGEDECTVDEAVAFCDAHLKDIPVLFFDGMWLHPSAPAIELAREEGLIGEAEDLDFDRIFLQNDFAANRRLNWFFPHVKSGRMAFLNRIYAKIRKYKRIVASRDVICDPETGIVKHAPELGVVEGARPWHLGMTGRGEETR